MQQMPIVRLELFPGRSAAKKAEIASEITAVLQRVAGIAPSDTTVLFIEVSPSDWVVNGKPLSERYVE